MQSWKNIKLKNVEATKCIKIEQRAKGEARRNRIDSISDITAERRGVDKKSESGDSMSTFVLA